MKSSSAVHCISLVLAVTVAVLCGCNQPEQETPRNVVPEATDAGDSNQNVVPEETEAGDSDRNQVRVENTDASGIRVVDARDQSIQAVDWLESRRQKQLATVDQFNVFHEFRFVDRQPESGIQFRHFAVDCATVKYKPVHYDHGNGMAIADVDNDGLLDIYFVTQIGRNELWRNLGGGTFEDITDSAGVAVMDRTSVAASFADIDNDGDADLYVTTVRDGNVLYANDGGGKFEDISDQSGLGYRGHSSSAVFFDFDRDGLLDVFLSNVGVYTTDKLINATAAGDGNHTYYLGLEDGFAGHLKPDRNEPSIYQVTIPPKSVIILAFRPQHG